MENLSLNSVDRIRGRIAKLEKRIFRKQQHCEHVFPPLAIKLEKTPVPGVLKLERFSTVDRVCLKCSFKSYYSITHGCPICSSTEWTIVLMTNTSVFGVKVDPPRSRGEYLDATYWTCGHCGLKLVVTGYTRQDQVMTL
jgi:hypothetical protein